MKRNKFISFLALGMAVTQFSCAVAQTSATQGDFALPKLAYSYDALEPYFDAATMEIHHTRHHQAYVTNLNKALEGQKKASLDEIVKNISKYSVAVRNNGGGHWNHSFFWEILGSGKTAPSAALLAKINQDFGSLDNLKAEFKKAATSRFGSGWAWLVVQNGKLKITSTANQDNPLMDVVDDKGAPILGLDVWEHAYYLKYQNKRADFIDAFWSVVNWDKVNEKFTKAK